MRDVKSSGNRTGWSRWWEGLFDLHVYSCERSAAKCPPPQQQQPSLVTLRPYVLARRVDALVQGNCEGNKQHKRCRWSIPPVHFLNQVCTYQEACSVETMRAVNTFETEREQVKTHTSNKHLEISNIELKTQWDLQDWAFAGVKGKEMFWNMSENVITVIDVCLATPKPLQMNSTIKGWGGVQIYQPNWLIWTQIPQREWNLITSWIKTGCSRNDIHSLLWC